MNTLSEYWVILEWSYVRGEWCELHQDYPTQEEAMNALKTLHKGFFKIEKQFQII